jgi:hypothetical protein
VGERAKLFTALGARARSSQNSRSWARAATPNGDLNPPAAAGEVWRSRFTASRFLNHVRSHPREKCEKLSGCGKTILIFISRSHSQEEEAGETVLPAAQINGCRRCASVRWDTFAIFCRRVHKPKCVWHERYRSTENFNRHRLQERDPIRIIKCLEEGSTKAFARACRQVQGAARSDGLAARCFVGERSDLNTPARATLAEVSHAGNPRWLLQRYGSSLPQPVRYPG